MDDAAINKFRTIRDPWDSFDCTVNYCNFSAQSSRELLSHLRKVHPKTKDINSPCLYSKQCTHIELFKTFSGLDTHLRKFHKEFFYTEKADKCDVNDNGELDTSTHLLSTDNSNDQTVIESTSTDNDGNLTKYNCLISV